MRRVVAAARRALPEARRDALPAVLPPKAKEVPAPGAVVAEQQLALVAGALAALTADIGDERHLGLVELCVCADKEEERHGAGPGVGEAVPEVAADRA